VELFRRTHAQTKLRASTRKGYENILERRLLPRFAGVKLARLQFPEVAALEADMVQLGMCPQSVGRILTVLRSVLHVACDAGLLERLPRMPRLPRPKKSITKTLSAEDVSRLLATATDTQRVALGLAAYAGLRAGEVRGLQWQDVDLDRRRLVVTRTIVDGIEGPPKSGHQREIPIGERLLEILQSRTRQLEQAGTPATAGTLVAPNAQGAVWGDSGLVQVLRRLTGRLGLPCWRFHDLRHHFVTELIRLGAPTAVVKELAGHADITTTERYAHMTEDDRRRAVALMDRPLGVPPTTPSTPSALVDAASGRLQEQPPAPPRATAKAERPTVAKSVGHVVQLSEWKRGHSTR